MKLVVAAMVLTACGPSSPSSVPLGPRPTIAPAFGSEAAFVELVRDGVMVGGMWFADDACRAQFSAPQKIEPARAAAFARCLSMLPLQESERVDALRDVVVLTYAPGFELEARVTGTGTGRRLSWIGYEAMRDDRDSLPTISSAALEQLRSSGDKHGALPPAVVEKLVGELPARNEHRAAFAWLKVCIDATGAVTSADPRMVTSAGARDAFVAAARTWQFRPFMAAGQAMPVCAMVRPTAPATAGPPVEALPFPAPPSHDGGEPLLLPDPQSVKRIVGDSVIVPDDPTKVAIQQSQVGPVTITGTFRVCIDRTGKVESVLPFQPTGVPAYDHKIIATVSKWGYEPYLDATGPVPVCIALTFIYSQR